jgi:hypothetical protein
MSASVARTKTASSRGTPASQGNHLRWMAQALKPALPTMTTKNASPAT